MTSKKKVLTVIDHASFHMDKIVGQFISGSKITVIVRPPGGVDGNRDFVLTDDDLDEAIAALTRRKRLGNELATKGLEEKL
jgi:hypothetical protein